MSGYTGKTETLQQDSGKVKPKRFTIQEIKRINIESGGHFFDRDTMRGFGNTMKDFRVIHINPTHEDQEIYIRAHNHNAPEGTDPIVYYQFDPATGRITRVNISHLSMRYMQVHQISRATERYISALAYEQG